MIVTVMHKDGRKEKYDAVVLTIDREVIVRPGTYTLVITDVPEKERS